jgi:hypothetical protein
MKPSSAATPPPTVDVDDLAEAIARVVEYNYEEDKDFRGSDDCHDNHIAKYLGTLTDWLNDDPKGTHWRKLQKQWKDEHS